MQAIDLFAGAGGFTQGAHMAGVEVRWAANHWPAAVACHAVNHPETVHACQDVQQTDWRTVPAHDVLLASPACQGHSRARGAEKPHHDALRSTAWAVVSCAEYHREDVLIVENVPDFQKWELFPVWADALRRLGYSLAPMLLDAADFGVPQNRLRLFIIATRSARPIRLRLDKRPHRPISDVIDWQGGGWSAVERVGRRPRTLARVSAGRAAHGARFVAPYYGSGSGLQGRSVDRPIGTITTKDRWSVIDGDRMRMLSVEEARAAMGFPAAYQLPAAKHAAMHLLGNAVVPQVAAELLAALRRAG